LVQLVAGKTFLARRHEELLYGTPLRLFWKSELVELQERVCAESDPVLRRGISLEFQRIVRETKPERYQRFLEQALRALQARPFAVRAGRTLLERVVGNTFRAARDESLVAGEALPVACPFRGDACVWRELRLTQGVIDWWLRIPGHAAAHYEASVEHVARLFSSEFATLVESLHARKRPPRLRGSMRS
jgi:hypothetical protein